MFSVCIKYFILLITTIPAVLSETTTTQSQNCYLPNFTELQNLTFKIHPQNYTIQLGSTFESYDVVHVECKNAGETLTGRSSLICRNGDWDNDFPRCENFCDGALVNRLSLNAICDYRDEYVKCPEKIQPGTYIRIQCAFGYSRLSSVQNLRCLPNGKFDRVPILCQMNCGLVTADSNEMDISKAPWHVPIYEYKNNQFNYICGGSIISPTIVISAAHCFWNELEHKLKNSTIYQIIAGRNSRNYSTEENTSSHLVNVKEVHIPIEYNGKVTGQVEDIAFLRLEAPLIYSKTIAPVCLAEDLRNRASKYMQSDRDGFVSGFGVNNELKLFNATTLAYHECVLKSQSNDSMAEDKFCIYSSEDPFFGHGNSGAGFVIGRTDIVTGASIYSLWGVVSHDINTSFKNRPDGNQLLVAQTNIFHTSPEFKKKLTDARSEDERLF